MRKLRKTAERGLGEAKYWCFNDMVLYPPLLTFLYLFAPALLIFAANFLFFGSILYKINMIKSKSGTIAGSVTAH